MVCELGSALSHDTYVTSGLHILQCQSPFFVTTKLSKLRHASLFVPSPDTWAAAAIGCIKPGVASTVPYWPHALQVCI